MTETLTPLREALDRVADRGGTIRVWLRDDDCVSPTRALDRLSVLCDGVGLPVLLAVIPEPSEATLAGWVSDHPGFVPCQHGFAHANHARPAERSIELGGTRSLAETLDELALGRDRLQALFGERLSDILVPPWNRIDPPLLPYLRGLGFSALSTIAPSRPGSPIRRCDCDLDIVDWRHGGVGRPLADLARLAAKIVAGQQTLGLLTHHLAHDGGAWAALGVLVERFATHPAVRFTSAGDLIGREVEADP